MNRFLSLAAMLGIASLSLNADARPARVGQLPNGSENGCANCHISAGGGGARNAFGVAVEGTLVDGAVDWAAIYNLDSDNDGYSNGEELGDPDGVWVSGAAGTYLSHPGEVDSTPCGNGAIEGPEECDGADIGDATCEAAGFGTGTVSCSSTCELSFADCENAPGNNQTNNATNNPTNNATNNPTNNATNNPTNNATNNPTNNAPGNNEPGNNATNNEPGNNATNNATNGPGGGGGSSDDEGCSTTGGSSAPFALLLGFSFFLRLRRRQG